MDRLQALLGSEARLETVAARQGSVAQMIDAFRVNLTALSLLALIVGMFLIYNTITFSVLQRRPLFGTLRCLGVTRAEIFALVLGEALLVGVLGAASGVLLGVLMGQGAIRLVTQTINDLFFVVSVRGVQVPTLSLLKGGVAGILAAALSAAPPAWEAAAVPPRQALSRSGLESKARRVIILAALAGLGLVLVGWGVLALPSRNLLLSFGGTSAVVVGFALLVPLLTRLLMQATALLMSRIGGVLGRMAPRDVVNSLSRTSIAVMALMVAVSVTIGVSLMVDSFRNTVITWLGETLQGDVYISGPSLVSTTPTTPIDPGIIEVLRGWPGITRLDMLRSVEVDSPQGSVHVSATNNYSVAQERLFLSTSIPVGQIWERMSQGGVLVSEPFANRFTLPHKGGSVILYTNDGPRTFPLLGIYYDYASTQGTVLMALPIYQQAWQDRSITSISLRLSEGVDVDRVVRDLQNKLSGGQQLVIRANSSLRQDVLQVFDRTFAITGALQLLATMVAFIGVLSALLSLELERQREFGILRSVGMTARQVWALILAETGLLGACAGLLAMPTGYALALILVYIINRRSFGWTLQMQVEARPFVEALAVALVAALLAGLYPAWRMGRMVPSEALRTE
jgi:putative ABC transport system permease protein